MVQIMAEETQLLEPGRAPRKRKLGKKQGRKMSNKRTKVMPFHQGQKKVKMDKKMKKLIRKRAREYNSDDDDDESSVPAIVGIGSLASITNKKNNEEDIESEQPSEDEEAGRQAMWKTKGVDMNNSDSEGEGEDDDMQPGITKFTEGCRAFRIAFKNIIKKSVSDESLVR